MKLLWLHCGITKTLEGFCRSIEHSLVHALVCCCRGPSMINISNLSCNLIGHAAILACTCQCIRLYLTPSVRGEVTQRLTTYGIHHKPSHNNSPHLLCTILHTCKHRHTGTYKHTCVAAHTYVYTHAVHHKLYIRVYVYTTRLHSTSTHHTQVCRDTCGHMQTRRHTIHTIHQTLHTSLQDSIPQMGETVAPHSKVKDQ